jgi:UDP-N-acetyl-D-mannosaminuronic acid dehydrogenase/UDP-N-acetyl-D-glucosamine dehydrogenase
MLVVLGQGYVGLPLSVRAVERGYHVVGLDVDRARVADLADGHSYVEDVSDADVADALATGRYIPTSQYAQCEGFDVAMITVPTPLREGLPDLSFIQSAGESLAQYLSPGALVILESTTYPGTTEELLAPILEGVSGLRAGDDFLLGYSPERIDPGNGSYDFVSTPKVLSGINEMSMRAVKSFYDDLIDSTVPVSSCRTAELTKLLENTFRHVNIALVNELAMYSHDLGIDIWEAIDASSTKPFGYMRFTPGPGVGGHCLPIDPSYLSWDVRRRLGTSFRFVELANDVNQHMPQYVVSRVGVLLNARERAIKGSRILLLGLAYKRDTSDARESPAVRVAELLVALGGDVAVVDPHVTRIHSSVRLRMVELTRDEVLSAHIVVVLTDHSDFDYGLLKEAEVVLDTRNHGIDNAVRL